MVELATDDHTDFLLDGVESRYLLFRKSGCVVWWQPGVSYISGYGGPTDPSPDGQKVCFRQFFEASLGCGVFYCLFVLHPDTPHPFHVPLPSATSLFPVFHNALPGSVWLDQGWGTQTTALVLLTYNRAFDCRFYLFFTADLRLAVYRLVRPPDFRHLFRLAVGLGFNDNLTLKRDNGKSRFTTSSNWGIFLK